MLLNSISHIVCKFQKDWMKKKAKIGDGPLKPLRFALKSFHERGSRVRWFLISELEQPSCTKKAGIQTSKSYRLLIA